jgi:hypothetical protein
LPLVIINFQTELKSHTKNCSFLNHLFFFSSLIFLVLFPSLLPAAQISLAWDPNNEPDLAGYKIYIGYQTRTYSWSIDAGKQTQGTVNNLVDGTAYYFALTAYNTQGLESGFSNEVTYMVPATSQATLTVSRSGTGSGTVTGTGISCGSDCSEAFVANTQVTLTAAADASSTFGGWSGACSGTANPCTVMMTSNLSVSAAFTLKTYTINASAGSYGSISPSGATTVAYGGSQAYTITAVAGYQVEDVKVDGSSVGPLSSYTFSNVAANHAIQATFVKITINQSNRSLKIYKKGSGKGVVTVSPTGTVFPQGTTVTLTADPEKGSTFVNWSGACSGKKPTCAITMSTNKSVTANFETVNDLPYKVYLPLVVQ